MSVNKFALGIASCCISSQRRLELGRALIGRQSGKKSTSPHIIFRGSRRKPFDLLLNEWDIENGLAIPIIVGGRTRHKGSSSFLPFPLYLFFPELDRPSLPPSLRPALKDNFFCLVPNVAPELPSFLSTRPTDRRPTSFARSLARSLNGDGNEMGTQKFPSFRNSKWSVARCTERVKRKAIAKKNTACSGDG